MSISLNLRYIHVSINLGVKDYHDRAGTQLTDLITIL